jgi:hypothetical protein
MGYLQFRTWRCTTEENPIDHTYTSLVLHIPALRLSNCLSHGLDKFIQPIKTNINGKEDSWEEVPVGPEKELAGGILRISSRPPWHLPTPSPLAGCRQSTAASFTRTTWPTPPRRASSEVISLNRTRTPHAVASPLFIFIDTPWLNGWILREEREER